MNPIMLHCSPHHTIPYTIPSGPRCIVLQRIMRMPLHCWPIAHDCLNGKEGRKGVYPGVSDVQLPPLWWQYMCVVYVREKEGRLTSLVSII